MAGMRFSLWCSVLGYGTMQCCKWVPRIGRTYCCHLQNKNKDVDNIFFQNENTNFSGNNVSISEMLYKISIMDYNKGKYKRHFPFNYILF